MPTYGRSFTLVNAGQNNVNSPSSGGGEAGKYTGESGFMAYYEVSSASSFVLLCMIFVWSDCLPRWFDFPSFAIIKMVTILMIMIMIIIMIIIMIMIMINKY